MKWIHSLVFVVSGAFSLLSVFAVAAGVMAGILVRIDTSAQVNQIARLGTAAMELGLFGVPAFSWLYLRSLKAHRINS